MKLSYFTDERPALLVVSHPRAGTHFLMNSLASCYGYVAQPWYNLDPINTHLNFYEPACLRQFLLELATGPLANLVKAHHTVDYFEGELQRITRRYVIFYIYRHPVDVLLSCWRFMHRWPWAGPRRADPVSYACSEPSGALLRYQLRQYPDMIRLWAAHVDGWLAAAESTPGIVPVRYEELDTHFEQTMRSLGRALGRSPQALIRPPRHHNIIPGGPDDPRGLGIPPNRTALAERCRERAGPTLWRLGYH